MSDQTAIQTTTAKGPLAHVLPYQSRKCSFALFSVGRLSPCAFTSTLVVAYVAQHSSQPLCLPLSTAYNHNLPMALTRTLAIHHRSRVTGLE